MARPGSEAVTLGNYLIALRDRIVQRSQLGKQKLDAALARRELDRKLQDLGETYLAVVREGRVPVPGELRGLLAEVEGLAQRLAGHHDQVRRLEEEAASGT
jgi:hypothetical protein